MSRARFRQRFHAYKDDGVPEETEEGEWHSLSREEEEEEVGWTGGSGGVSGSNAVSWERERLVASLPLPFADDAFPPARVGARGFCATTAAGDGDAAAGGECSSCVAFSSSRWGTRSEEADRVFVHGREECAGGVARCALVEDGMGEGGRPPLDLGTAVEEEEEARVGVDGNDAAAEASRSPDAVDLRDASPIRFFLRGIPLL